jgi:hypothetical protein
LLTRGTYAAKEHQASSRGSTCTGTSTDASGRGASTYPRGGPGPGAQHVSGVQQQLVDARGRFDALECASVNGKRGGPGATGCTGWWCGSGECGALLEAE